MKGYHAALQESASSNEYFRRVLYTAAGGQLVLMCLVPGQDIGMEVHHDVDQFFWVVQGTARAELDGEVAIVSHGEVLVVPRGTDHNITNASQTDSLKLFTVYTPPNHPDGTIHKTKAEAMAAEEHE